MDNIDPEIFTSLFEYVEGDEPGDLSVKKIKDKMGLKLKFKIGDPLLFQGTLKKTKRTKGIRTSKNNHSKKHSSLRLNRR